ncbi:MAG: efflux RND transporter periplasmic adaptor subunit [Phycisphaerae bacterium]|nr:efflux RND transporter periplasmic adaptor subunit [Phycisphaerae bacterium]
MQFVRGLAGVAALAAAFALGGWLLAGNGPGGQSVSATTAPSDAVQYWTCSMHPQIRLPEKGPCPICFMDLIPVQAGAGDESAPQLALGERARTLARVQTAAVELREMTHELHMVGKVAPDETRITYVSSYIPGRLDRLFVNYAGIFVRKGDHLAEMYSPELLVGQQEFLLGLEGVERARNASDASMRQRAEAVFEAARRKLELWAIPKDEVERLQRERRPTDQVRIDAPQSGWVLERLAFQGMYVETGTRLFTLADLRSVWVMLDAYELDLPFLRYGQRVEFVTEAYPGRKFEGRISYIDPRLTELTRTVKVRVNVINDDMQLRPGMFLRAAVRVQLGEGGQAIEPSLVGKWICPMHPEIVKDTPGKCDNCGMDLVTAESLGFATPQSPGARVLAVPQTAVLLTGRRAVVYVENQRTSGGVSYEGRVVELGPRAGEWYVVKSGLVDGERVATHGAFQIDSALQIQARPSMMQPVGDAPSSQPGADHASLAASTQRIESHAVAGAMYHQQLRPVLDAAIAFTEALAADDGEAARSAAEKLREGLKQASPQGLSGKSVDVFAERIEALRKSLPNAEKTDIDALRDQLAPLNRAVENYVQTFGHDRPQPLVRMFCPMAFDNRGASWLQLDDKVRNPYFGKRMFRCGEATTAFAADGSEVRP